jgi:hypothetical protein
MPDSYQQLQSRAEQAERDSMINALAAANADSEAGKVELQTAWQNGDYAGVAEAQERISRAQARAVTLEGGIEASDERQNGSGYVAQPQQPQQQYTAKRIIDRMTNLSHDERAWLMKHPELVTNPEGQLRLQAAWYESQQKGIERDSPEYFGFFDESFSFSPVQTLTSPQQQYVVGGPNVQRQHQSPTKPYVPETPKVNLTEQEAAKISGVDMATYRANQKKLQQLKALGMYSDR